MPSSDHSLVGLDVFKRVGVVSSPAAVSVANKRVVAELSQQGIAVSVIAVEVVVTGIAADHVAIVATRHNVVAPTSADVVVAGSAPDRIGTIKISLAAELVVSADHVMASIASNRVNIGLFHVLLGSTNL